MADIEEMDEDLSVDHNGMSTVVRSQIVATLLILVWTKVAILYFARAMVLPSYDAIASHPVILSCLYLLEVFHQDLTVAVALVGLAAWLVRDAPEGAAPPRGRAPMTLLLVVTLTVSIYQLLAFLYWWNYAAFPSKSILALWNHLGVAVHEMAADTSRTRWGPIPMGGFAIHLVSLLLRGPIERGWRGAARRTWFQVGGCILVGFLIASWTTSIPVMLASANQNPVLALVLVPTNEELLAGCPDSFGGGTASPCPEAAATPAPVPSVTPITSTADGATPARRPPRRVVVYLWESMPSGAVFDRTGACRIPELEALRGQMVNFSRLYTVQPQSFPSLVSLLTGAYSPPMLKYSTQAAWVAKHAATAPVAPLRQKGWRLRPATSSVEDFAGYQNLFEVLGFEPMVLGEKTGSPAYRSHVWGLDDRFLFDTARRWLSEKEGLPQFLLLISSCTHHPYRYDADASGTLSAKERHAALTRETGRYIAELYAWLQEQKLDEETLFLVLGDHGQAFGEHEGNWIHGAKLYEESTHVAGFLLHPQRAGLPAEIPQVLSTSNLLKIVLDPELGQPGHTTVPDHGVALTIHPLLPGRVSLVKDGRKLIVDLALKKRELYDLEHDPAERKDLSVQESQLADCYQALLGAQTRAIAAGWP